MTDFPRPRPRHLAFAALLALAAPAALSQEPPLPACPVAADLARGIEITDDAGLVELLRSDRPGVVLSLITGPGFELHALLREGVYLMESGPSHQGDPIGFERLILDLSALALPVPAAGAQWSGEVSAISAMGTIPVRIDYEFGQPEDLSIGPCRYVTLPVTMTFPLEEPPYYERLRYLPDLGLSRVEQRGLVGAEAPQETSTAVSIRSPG